MKQLFPCWGPNWQNVFTDRSCVRDELTFGNGARPPRPSLYRPDRRRRSVAHRGREPLRSPILGLAGGARQCAHGDGVKEASTYDIAPHSSVERGHGVASSRATRTFTVSLSRNGRAARRGAVVASYAGWLEPRKTSRNRSPVIQLRQSFRQQFLLARVLGKRYGAPNLTRLILSE